MLRNIILLPHLPLHHRYSHFYFLFWIKRNLAGIYVFVMFKDFKIKIKISASIISGVRLFSADSSSLYMILCHPGCRAIDTHVSLKTQNMFIIYPFWTYIQTPFKSVATQNKRMHFVCDSKIANIFWITYKLLL